NLCSCSLAPLLSPYPSGAPRGLHSFPTRRSSDLIRAEAVLTLITDMLRAIAEYSKNDRAEFIRTVQETQAAQQTADISKKRKRLAAAQKRAGELERLICKIYEDNALGKLPDARYEALDA